MSFPSFFRKLVFIIFSEIIIVVSVLLSPSFWSSFQIIFSFSSHGKNFLHCCIFHFDNLSKFAFCFYLFLFLFLSSCSLQNSFFVFRISFYCICFSSLLYYCFLSPFPTVHSSHSSLSLFFYFSTSLFSFCYLFLLDLRFFCLYVVLFFSYFLVVMFSVFLHFQSFCLFFLSFTLFAVSLCPFVLLHTLFLISPLRSPPFLKLILLCFGNPLCILICHVFMFLSSSRKHLK